VATSSSSSRRVTKAARFGPKEAKWDAGVIPEPISELTRTSAERSSWSRSSSVAVPGSAA
jgi:hypothetical protein